MRSALATTTASLLGLAAAATLLVPGGTLAEREGEGAGSLPGLEAAGLTREQAEAVEAFARSAYCHCGCPHTLGQCLRQHAECKHAPRMRDMAIRLARAGATGNELRQALDAYYASFDRSRRTRLDLAEFEPPLGKPEAPVTIVEFSDFTCPYCRALRPLLEAFVAESAGRVKLYYKPFPIPSHARAREAALAGEWARGQGVFWKMHDLLFQHPHALSDGDLASYAREAGGDPEDLSRALAEGRADARVRASQVEARRAGLEGTPTLFIDGRRLGLVVAVEAMPDLLRATLEDEEEWRAQGRFTKD